MLHEYNYVSMDTEYPGTPFLPNLVTYDFDYQVLRINVNNLKLIQVGITLANGQGKHPAEGTYCWQFNLFFDI